MSNGHKILVGRPEGKKPPGRPSRRWEVISNMNVREISFGVSWINPDEGRKQCWALVKTVMNLRIV
jgi:hypothetical protein